MLPDFILHIGISRLKLSPDRAKVREEFIPFERAKRFDNGFSFPQPAFSDSSPNGVLDAVNARRTITGAYIL
jgi:hypothetical protein